MNSSCDLDALKQDLLDTIGETRNLLTQNEEWRSRFAGYAQEITENLDFIQSVRRSFYEWDPLFYAHAPECKPNK